MSGIKKAHIAVSLILLVAETGIEPVTRGFSIALGAFIGAGFRDYVQ